VTRRRLEPQQRREELLDVGAAMFAEKPYEDVFVEDIAARACVSRALMYHYYPNKRELYVAILKRASNRFLARVSPDPRLPLAEQLTTGLEAHIQSLVDHPFEAVAIHRGALSYDPAIQAIIAEELNVVGQRLINQLVAQGCLRDATEIAIEGWLAFVRAAYVKWIQSQNISRADLTEMCLRAFDCALGTPTSRLRGGPAFSGSRSLSRLASWAFSLRTRYPTETRVVAGQFRDRRPANSRARAQDNASIGPRRR
jgi:AcrR family transcriptional regulator